MYECGLMSKCTIQFEKYLRIEYLVAMSALQLGGLSWCQITDFGLAFLYAFEPF